MYATLWGHRGTISDVLILRRVSERRNCNKRTNLCKKNMISKSFISLILPAETEKSILFWHFSDLLWLWGRLEEHREYFVSELLMKLPYSNQCIEEWSSFAILIFRTISWKYNPLGLFSRRCVILFHVYPIDIVQFSVYFSRIEKDSQFNWEKNRWIEKAKS